jgi:Methyltransferase domain
VISSFSAYSKSEIPHIKNSRLLLASPISGWMNTMRTAALTVLSMKCLICHSETSYFLSKTYTEKPYDEFMSVIGEVQYHKCDNCGFTSSKTHRELNAELWEKLNYDFHHHLESLSPEEQLRINQPPYLQQAVMLKVLSENGMIDATDMLDYAGGYGRLSDILVEYFGLKLPVYDPYIQQNERGIYVNKEDLRKYKVVLNSALFEHLISRESFDEINNCVADDGCMIIHTVICENIPKDANWFYFRPPVHCAFHTNKSMSILMEQWNYKSSIYCPASKCWVLFKNKSAADIAALTKKVNQEFQTEYMIYKNGFVDYWKGF